VKTRRLVFAPACLAIVARGADDPAMRDQKLPRSAPTLLSLSHLIDPLPKIVLTSSFTVLGGIIVLVVGQLILKFVVEPIQEFAPLRQQFFAILQPGFPLLPPVGTPMN
jgi:hypothetical protein